MGLYEQAKKVPSPPVSQFNSRVHGLSVLRTSFLNVIFRQPNCGSGDFTYECAHNRDRAELPADHEYGNASHGVAIDSQHRVYITHDGNPGSLFVFDTDGRFIRAMGEVHNVGPAAKWHGISFREDGGEEFLCLAPADSGMSFTKMSLTGEVVWVKNRETINNDSPEFLSDPQTIFRPTNISFRPDGGYYFGDGYGKC